MTASPDWRMKPAISVKSPFSHNALFGFMKAPFSGPTLCGEPCSELQSYSDSIGTTMPERRDDLLERLADVDSFARRPRNFAGNPGDRMDAFSQILSGVKLNGAVFFTAEFSAPWGLSTPASDTMAATIAPGVEHLVLYHLVIEGSAVIELTDGQCTELMPGDVVIFPHGD